MYSRVSGFAELFIVNDVCWLYRYLPATLLCNECFTFILKFADPVHEPEGIFPCRGEGRMVATFQVCGIEKVEKLLFFFGARQKQRDEPRRPRRRYFANTASECSFTSLPKRARMSARRHNSAAWWSINKGIAHPPLSKESFACSKNCPPLSKPVRNRRCAAAAASPLFFIAGKGKETPGAQYTCFSSVQAKP